MVAQPLPEGSQMDAPGVRDGNVVTPIIPVVVGDDWKAVLLWRALRIAMLAEDLFGTLMASGIVCWFAFQMFQNIGMVIGIMPVTGIPLPLMSYGGSSLIATLACLGLVANVYARRFS